MSNGLFSGLRAAAAAFGKAAGGVSRTDEPPAPIADINRLVERIHQERTHRERSEAETLALDIELASSAAGSRPMTAELMSLIRAYDTARWEQDHKGIAKRLQALSPEQRGDLF